MKGRFIVMTPEEWRRFYTRMMAVYSVFYRRMRFSLNKLGPLSGNALKD